MKNHIAIWLGTFKRPNMLENTLKSFCKINIPDNTEISLIVLDNDVDGSANEIFEQYQSILPFHSSYQINSERGIVSQRNKFIEETLKMATPMLRWLMMMKLQKEIGL